ncbi:MAG: DUF2185 domain-containing protein [Gracilibacteraceae bacterium]|jgi:hypothetical protein|nr:DUF2185 domain-containing protein [Gracilibacteraceae bacterium]
MGLFGFGKKKKDDAGKAGSGGGSSRPEVYDEADWNAVDAHIAKHFGDGDGVFHEIVSPDIHLDIYMCEPTAERPYYTLVTHGMGARRMNVPEALAEHRWERAELFICVPPDWNLKDLKDENNYWPLRWLKILARLPIEQNTWLGYGHTVPAGEALADNNNFTGFMLSMPYAFGAAASVCELPGGDPVHFYQILPLYEDEMEYKLANGAEALDDLLDDDALVVDLQRSSALAKLGDEADDREAELKESRLPAILAELKDFRAELESIPWKTGGELESDRRKFILVLSGLAACRMSPGLPGNMGHESLAKCANEAERDALRKHLDELFEITNEESLWDALNNLHQSYSEYDSFRAFWAGRPQFDLGELNPRGRKLFESSMAFAAKLRDVVGNNGFLAWDVNERIGMCRRAYAAGFISEAEFWEAGESMAIRAAAYYDNWGEYALSCICGSVYYEFRRMYDGDESRVGQFYDIQMGLVRALTAEDGLWRRYGWPDYRRGGKKYAIRAKDMIDMIPDWDGPTGCFATDRITVDGAKVGHMYREAPDFDGDSGWRFTAGDESDEYMGNPDNSGIFSLESICNDDPDIIEYLNSEAGSAFARENGGPLRPVDDNE